MLDLSVLMPRTSPSPSFSRVSERQRSTLKFQAFKCYCYIIVKHPEHSKQCLLRRCPNHHWILTSCLSKPGICRVPSVPRILRHSPVAPAYVLIGKSMSLSQILQISTLCADGLGPSSGQNSPGSSSDP